MTEVLRLYAPHELARDGYPLQWHKLPCERCSGRGEYDCGPAGEVRMEPCLDCEGRKTGPGIKHLVRRAALDRCIRCAHPYEQGDPRISAGGEWSPCDGRCLHGGPMRLFDPEFRRAIAQIEDGRPGWQHHVFVPGGTWRREARWRVLTVHHLDMNKANCRWWNLAALCQRCHLQIQGKVQMRRVWPWEHTDWFKPYVAGYYAWTYLGENLSREATELRLEDLLALERAA